MARLFANRIVAGKTQFIDVPSKLKAAVADILINEMNRPDLVPTENNA